MNFVGKEALSRPPLVKYSMLGCLQGYDGFRLCRIEISEDDVELKNC